MVEHSASIMVKAPIHQVYMLFTHFHDFPKFMSFVKEVTYYDEQRSHWVVKALGEYEWDAVNENWKPDEQVGWRSTRGLNNSGVVKFHALGPERTSVYVYIHYSPPSGPLGSVGEHLGINAYFDAILQKDLTNFARMVEESPSGALDPMSSHYLFHNTSAMHKGEITARQQAAMQHDPMMRPQVLAQRQAQIVYETALREQRAAAQAAELEKQKLAEALRIQEQQIILLRAAEIIRREQITREEALRKAESIPLDPHLVYAAKAHGLGDKDGLRARNPNNTQDPMTSRKLPKLTKK
jgi:Predicted integral membrane protein